MNNTLKISLFFMFVFMWYNSVQQYITSFLYSSWFLTLGFFILIIIYVFFTIWCFLSETITNKLWFKNSIILGAILYSGFIASLATKNVYIIYITSGLLWLGASLVRTSWNIIVIKDSESKNIWQNSGIFNLFYSLWTIIWMIVIWFLISNFWYTNSFYIQAILPLIWILFILSLKNEKNRSENKKDWFSIKLLLKSKTLLRISLIRFINFFIFWLIISILPYTIKDIVGEKYIWILSSIFYILLLILSYPIGKLIDIKARKDIIKITYIILMIWLLILYITWNHTRWLITWIVIVGISFVINNIINITLIGDISNEKNIQHIVPFAWIIQNIWAISAFILSSIWLNSTIYIIAIIIVIISYYFLRNVLRVDLQRLKSIIAEELL